MALAASLIGQETGDTIRTLYISITPSGSYATGGDTLDFTKLANPLGLPKAFVGKNPTIFGVMNEEMSGAYVGIIAGTALTNWKIKFYAAAGTELSAAAYPGGVTGGTLSITIAVPAAY